MPARRPRIKPRDFGDYKERVGWETNHALSLLGTKTAISRSRTAKQAGDELKGLAKRYLNWFRQEPSRTHIFPMVGAFLQCEFARGVRDAAGLKTRIRPITPLMVHDDTDRLRMQRYLRPQAKGLKETGIVMHDHVGRRGSTRDAIAKAAGIPKEQIGLHQLTKSQVHPEAAVPVPGGQKIVGLPFSFFAKTVDPKTDRVKLVPTETLISGLPADVSLGSTYSLSREERNSVRRALYAAGYAATKELARERAK